MSAPTLPIGPRNVAPSFPEAPPALDSAIADSDDEADGIAPTSAIVHRSSRKESRGMSSSEVSRLSSSPSLGLPWKPWFIDSLGPSSVLQIDEGALPASGTATRRTSHASSPFPVIKDPLLQSSALPQPIKQATFIVDNTTPSGDEAGGQVSEARETGSLFSTKGVLILVVVGMSQLLDNISMTSVNLAISAISEELGISPADEQWLISAYTLTFGGFLLLGGVFADRWGKKVVFLSGMMWLSIWTLLVGFAKTEIATIIFRALQGLGAAASIPSSIGIVTSFFVGQERNYALSIYGACGALGFNLGLIFGGIFTSLLGWRYVFWLTAPLGFIACALAWWVLPADKKISQDAAKVSLDFLGAGLGTSGLILLTFVLSSGGAYGWGKWFIIVLLVTSVATLVGFAFAERKVKNPLLPSYLWNQPGFAVTWILGFLIYCFWQACVLWLVLMSQKILGNSPLRTALYFLPMGPMGLLSSYFAGWSVIHYRIKHLMILGFAISAISPIPAAVMIPSTSYWASIFPSCMIGVIGISLVYNVVSISMMASVPPAAKSLAGGLINTAFQIGAGFGLAICTAVITGTTKGEDVNAIPVILKGYQNGLWTTVGFCSAGLPLIIFGLKSTMLEVGPSAPVH